MYIVQGIPTHQEQEVCVRAVELGDVRKLQFLGVGFVQTHAKVPLSTEQQQDEDTEVEHSHQSWGGMEEGSERGERGEGGEGGGGGRMVGPYSDTNTPATTLVHEYS